MFDWEEVGGSFVKTGRCLALILALRALILIAKMGFEVSAVVNYSQLLVVLPNKEPIIRQR